MLKLPEKKNKLLLHVCCAPCAGAIIEDLKEANINFTVFFYNPNIFPKKEYETRRDEVIKYCKKMKVSLIIAESDKCKKQWEQCVKGLESEPERGRRCQKCTFHRLEKTMEYAKKNGFDLVATTLSFSKWKDMFLVNTCGNAVAKDIEGIDFWAKDWRKDNRNERANTISKEEGFYRQKYCGCFYSIGDNIA